MLRLQDAANQSELHCQFFRINTNASASAIDDFTNQRQNIALLITTGMQFLHECKIYKSQAYQGNRQFHWPENELLERLAERISEIKTAIDSQFIHGTILDVFTKAVLHFHEHYQVVRKDVHGKENTDFKKIIKPLAKELQQAISEAGLNVKKHFNDINSSNP